MKSRRLRSTILSFATFCMLALLPTLSVAQTTTTGELSGAVTDASGAVVSVSAIAPGFTGSEKRVQVGLGSSAAREHTAGGRHRPRDSRSHRYGGFPRD
jgi:hypothetical protein